VQQSLLLAAAATGEAACSAGSCHLLQQS
jgi:hypothetical protein